MQLTSLLGGGFSICRTQDMAQNIILLAFWERIKCLWHCLMTTLLLFGLFWLFLFVSAFLTSLIKLTLWPKLSTDRRHEQEIAGWAGKDHRVLFCFSFPMTTFFFLVFYFLNFKIFNSYMRSQTWTPLPPPSSQHPSGSSSCTSPKHELTNHPLIPLT